jgi:hypothetical protein
MPIFDWMNSSQYLAQIGHFAFGYAIIITAIAISLIRDWGWKFTLWTLGIGIAAASLKEFWFDMLYELPKQTFGDSFMDWFFYVFGAGVGLLVAWLLVNNVVRKVPVIKN